MILALIGCVIITKDQARDRQEAVDENEDTSSAPGWAGLSLGANHTCALLDNGTLHCWGNPEDGRTAAPTEIFTAVSAGDKHTCGLSSSGASSSVVCFGSNSSGQATPPSGTFAAVESGSLHTCALSAAGQATCWGFDENGQTEVPVSTTFSAISGGLNHTCGLKTSGEILCWGDNSYGQLDAPAGSFTQIAAGDYHTCALDAEGLPSCWGANLSQVDFGQVDAPAHYFSKIVSGGFHSCGLRTATPDVPDDNGNVAPNEQYILCWGKDSSQQVSGNYVPEKFIDVGAGGEHTCGVAEDGFLRCWGYNVYGQCDVPAELQEPAEGS